MRIRRGTSLLETVIAIGLLLMALLYVLPMLALPGLPAGSNHNLMVATTIGQDTAESIRVYMQSNPSAFASAVMGTPGSIVPYSSPAPDPLHPAFTVSADLTPEDESQAALSPVTVPVVGCITMQHSILKICVTVAWTEGVTPESLQTVAFVAEPPNPIATLSISPTAVGSALNGTNSGTPVTLTASAVDSNNNPIPDLEFRWYLVAHGTYGTMSVSADSTQMTFTPTTNYGPAGQCTCNVQVRAISAGQLMQTNPSLVTITVGP